MNSWSVQEIADAIAAANAKLNNPTLSDDDRILARAQADVLKELAEMLHEEAPEPAMAAGE
jgi:hypothetical protein